MRKWQQRRKLEGSDGKSAWKEHMELRAMNFFPFFLSATYLIYLGIVRHKLVNAMPFNQAHMLLSSTLKTRTSLPAIEMPCVLWNRPSGQRASSAIDFEFGNNLANH